MYFYNGHGLQMLLFDGFSELEILENLIVLYFSKVNIKGFEIDVSMRPQTTACKNPIFYKSKDIFVAWCV